jgi:hypothetical protein
VRFGRRRHCAFHCLLPCRLLRTEKLHKPAHSTKSVAPSASRASSVDFRLHSISSGEIDISKAESLICSTLIERDATSQLTIYFRLYSWSARRDDSLATYAVLYSIRWTTAAVGSLRLQLPLLGAQERPGEDSPDNPRSLPTSGTTTEKAYAHAPPIAHDQCVLDVPLEERLSHVALNCWWLKSYYL